MPLVASVIVPALDAERTLSACLRALRGQALGQGSIEVIVVDDASTDATARIAAEAGVRVIRQPVRAGQGAARNRGAGEARGEILVFTDADCEPAPDFVERIVAPLLLDPTVVGVKGTYVSAQRQLVARFVQYEYEDRYRRMARLFAARGSIDFVDTYAAAYRRADFLSSGGFVEEAFFTLEDQELSFRLASLGKRLVFEPAARVRHWGHAASLRAYVRKKYAIGYWKAAVLRRHPSKILHDAHTPQLLKLQLALVVLPPLFVLTTLPFTWRTLRRDPAVAALAPALLYARALALAVGLVAGALCAPRLAMTPRQPLRPSPSS